MKNINVKNLPDDYYKWLKEKAQETGTTMTTIIKMLIKEGIRKDKKQD